MEFGETAVKWRKISAPLHLLNVDAPNFLTPETTNNNNQTTNDDIEDIDEISSSFEGKGSIFNREEVGKPKGRPITQILESLNKDKSSTVRNNLSEFTNIFEGSQTVATTDCFEDTGKINIKFDGSVGEAKSIVPQRGLVQNRIKPNDAKQKSLPISDVWLMLEQNAVTSTTKKSTTNKVIKFPRKTNKQRQQNNQENKLRQTTLGIPSTKSTLKGKKSNKKPKKEIQSEIPFKQNEVKAPEIKEDKKLDIQVVQTDDSVHTSQLVHQVDEVSTTTTSPTVKYRKRAMRKLASKFKIHVQEGIESGPESVGSEGEYIIRSDHSLQNSQHSDSELSFDDDDDYHPLKTESKKKPAPRKRKPEPIESEAELLHKTSTKESKKKINPKKKARSKLNSPKNEVEQVETEPQNEVQITASYSTLALVQVDDNLEEENFQAQVHKGLSLLSASLLNRMKVVQLELSRKELKLKNDLESKFKELDEFQRTQRHKFKDYLEELVSQMTSSEKELENWLQKNNAL